MINEIENAALIDHLKATHFADLEPDLQVRIGQWGSLFSYDKYLGGDITAATEDLPQDGELLKLKFIEAVTS